MQLNNQGKVTNDRGDRFSPSRSSRTYWILTCLRREMEQITQRYVIGKKIARLVDYGCGNMPYRPLFTPHVGEYCGIDFVGNTLANVTMEGDGLLPLDSASADLVLSTQVLEHVSNPSQYLGECKRVLRGDGKLVLSTHGIWQFHPDPQDYWRWTSDGLRKAVNDAGFDIIDFHGIMAPAAAGLQIIQDAFHMRVHRRARKVFYYVMQSLIEWADDYVSREERDRDASVFVLVAHPRSVTRDPDE